ncbi:MAG TPA: helix-turn-helix domain-containing protein [Gemmataceae bacterium]|nr:helix-turn-helix domain-containing protein [Gemmataceae bacterium]
MRTRPKPLTEAELAAACRDGSGVPLKPVMSPDEFAEFVGLSVKTVYEWLARGRFSNAARRRGKHVLIWRDRAISELFSGPDWKS